MKKRIKITEDQIQQDGSEEEAPPQPANNIQKKNSESVHAKAMAKGTVQLEKKKSGEKFVYHVVQPGDTLWNIAQLYKGVTVAEIKKLNNISSSKNLKAGTKLKIIVSG